MARTFPCPRCSERGYIRAFLHVANGICFLCGGAGVCNARPDTRGFVVGTVYDGHGEECGTETRFHYGVGGAAVIVTGLEAKSRGELLNLASNALRALASKADDDHAGLDHNATYLAIVLDVLACQRAEARALFAAGGRRELLVERLAEIRERVPARVA